MKEEKNKAAKPAKNPVEQVQLFAMLPTFAALFDLCGDIVIVYTLQCEPVYANPATLAKLKITDLESLKNVSSSAKFVQYQDALRNTIESASQQKILLSVQQAKLGREIYDLVHISPIRDAKDKLVGVIAIGRDMDLNAAKEREEANRRAGYLRTLLDTFPFMVWMKDEKSRFLAVNKAFSLATKSLDVYDLEGKTDFDCHPEFAEAYVKDDQEVMQTRQPKTVIEQIRQIEKDCWAETYKSPVIVSGKVVGTVGFARDITEQLVMRDTLTRQKMEFNTLVENIPMVILRYDTECRRIYVSPYRGNTYQLKHLELSRSPEDTWDNNISGVSGKSYTEMLRQVIKTGIPIEKELVLDVNGIKHYGQVKIVPEFDEQQKVKSVLAIVNDITELVNYRTKIEYMAYHDALTGILNRAAFAERAQVMLRQIDKTKRKIAVMILDLDQFKSINDSMGHAVGDILLVEVARRIAGSIPVEGLFARLGGDEFAILISDYEDKTHLIDLANTLLQEIKKPLLLENAEYFVSASIGIARYRVDSVSLDELMKFADTAMYAAKRLGRNNHQFYSLDLTLDVKKDLHIRTSLRQVVDQNGLHLEFQPILDMYTHEIAGAEVLCRWSNSVFGTIQPSDFIPVAEETGVIVEIGYWVLQQAFAVAKQMNQNRSSPIKFSINISPRQFFEADFVAQVRSFLAITHCEPHWIKFEITETLLLQDNLRIQNALGALSQLGVQISIDDFGTGYSGLSYLNKFPIHQLKIDRSFIKSIVEDQETALLSKAIIAMVNSLGKDLVAEGVETEAQARLLQSFGCRYAQGYLYAKPMSIALFQEMLIEEGLK